MSGGVKWRFHETANSSLAIKAAVVFPSGNQRVGHGSGRMNLALTGIAAYQIGPWAWYGNLGLASQRQAQDADTAAGHALLWQASAALSYELTRNWKMLADIGIARNPNTSAGSHPAYLLSGLIYSPNQHVDLDAGVKFGLSRAETDHQFGVGLSWRF